MKNKIFFLTILLTFVFFSAYSQTGKWKGKFSIGGSYYKGNVNKIDIRSIGEISHKDSTFEFSTAYKTIYARTDKIENNREFSSIAKFDWKPYSIISPFIAFQPYHNIYKGYDLRLTGIFGSKITFLSSPTYSYSLSVAGLYSFEKYAPPSNPDEETKADAEKMRLSVRPKIKHQLGKNVSVSHYTFYMPNVRNFNDYIIESRTSLTNKLTSILFLDLSFEYEYVSIPPSSDIEKDDYAFVISLIVKL